MSTTRPDSQRGIGIIAAMVVTVVIAGLIIVLSRTTSTQALSVALDDRGVRAYWAARAGIDWGSWQITQNGTACAASHVLAIPVTATSISEFQVTVECSGAGPHLLRATACAPVADCGAGTKSAFYVERVITRTLQ